MWSHWQREMHFTLHIRCSRPSQLSTFPVVTEASDTNACVGYDQNICTDCAEPGCFRCCADKQKARALSVCPSTRPERTSQAQPAAAACFYQLRIWLWPSSRATLPARVKSWKIDEQSERGAVSHLQGTANGTSRHILTEPVLSWLNSCNSDIVQSSSFSS